MPDIDPQNVFLGRQPILDRNQQLFAYELLFRSAGADQGNFASFIDGNQATATVIVNAFSEFSLADALGLSAATLRRRLDAEGAAWGPLKDAVRRDLALQLLADPHKAAGFARIVFDLLVSGQSNPAR